MSGVSEKINAINTRLWAANKAKSWEAASLVQSSTPQMCVEREIAAALKLAANKSDELLSILANSPPRS